MFTDYGEIFTAQEIMEILFVGKNTVYELLNSGELKGFRIGKTWRVTKESLENFISERSRE